MEKDGPDVVLTVVAVKTDDEIIEYENANLKGGYEYWRTTEGEFYGIVDSDISIAIN